MERNRDVVSSDPPIIFVRQVLPIAEALADFLRIATMYLNGKSTQLPAASKPPAVGNGAVTPAHSSKSHRAVIPDSVPLIRDKEYTPLEASKILKCALVTVRKRMGREEIRYVKRGSRCFILGQEILDIMIKEGTGTTEDPALTQ